MNTYCVFHSPGEDPIRVRAESYASPLSNHPTMTVQLYIDKQVVAEFAGVQGICLERAWVKGSPAKKKS